MTGRRPRNLAIVLGGLALAGCADMRPFQGPDGAWANPAGAAERQQEDNAEIHSFFYPREGYP